MTDDGSPLEAAGLAPEDEQIYLFVVHRGRTGPDDVVQRFGLPASEAVERLEHLHDLGLVARPNRTVDAYAAVDPRVALSAIADRLSGHARSIRERIPALADQFERGAQDGSSAQTRIVTDTGDIASLYVRLQHQVKQELLMFDRPPYVATALAQLEASMMARGVVWRAVYTADSFAHDGAWEEVARLAELGEVGRVVTELPVKLAIADRAVALVSLSVDGVRFDTLLTESAPLIEMLCGVFESHWARAIPLSSTALDDLRRQPVEAASRPRPAGPGPTSEQQSILALIGAGLTDDAIAVRLGISVRSLRRRSQQLMTELGAANRFQLGVEAARRGWV